MLRFECLRLFGIAAVTLLQAACVGTRPVDETTANGDTRDAAIAAYRTALAEDPGATEVWRFLGSELLENPADVLEAESAFQRAFEQAKTQGDRPEMALNKSALGYAALKRDDKASAIARFRDALEMHRALGDGEGMAWDYAALSSVYLQNGQLRRAERTALDALASNASGEVIAAVSQQLLSIGYAHAARDARGQTARLVATAEDIERRLAAPVREINSFNALGLAQLKSWNLEAAERLFRQALAAAFEVGATQQIGESYQHLGAVFERKGNLETAASLYREALRSFETSGSRRRQQQVDAALRRVAYRQSRATSSAEYSE